MENKPNKTPVCRRNIKNKNFQSSLIYLSGISNSMIGQRAQFKGFILSTWNCYSKYVFFNYDTGVNTQAFVDFKI